MIYFSDFGAGSGLSPIVLEPPTSAYFTLTPINSPTTVDGTESLRITGSRDASLIRGLLRTIPSVDFSVIIQMRANLVTPFNGAGIIFRDTGGKYIGVNNTHGDDSTFSSITQYSDHTTYSGSDAAGSRTHGDTTTPTWFKATFTASSNDVEGFYSYTREGPWQSIGTSTYLGTADAFGIGITHSQASGTDEVHAFFTYFEVQ